MTRYWWPMLPDCLCGHPRDHHEHYSAQAHCGTCRCRRYRRPRARWRGRGTRQRGSGPAVTRRDWLRAWLRGE